MTGESIRDRMEKDARWALLRNAIFSIESLLVVGGTALLTAFVQPVPGWPWWAWPLVGLVAEAAVIITTLRNKEEAQKVVESLYYEKYNMDGIRDRDLQHKLREADQYRKRIQQLVEQQPPGPLRDRLASTTADVYEWIANMVRLARRIDNFRTDPIIKSDLRDVPGEIKTLQARYNMEKDEQVKAQMAQTLESKQLQQAQLLELKSRMQRADLQLDHSLSALGTVYAQILLVGSRDADSDRADRLQEDIRSEVDALNDLIESLNEVYSGDAELDALEEEIKKTAAARQMSGRQS
jgi:hypothetical protein